MEDRETRAEEAAEVERQGFRSSSRHGKTPHAWSVKRRIGRSVAAEALSPVSVLQDVMVAGCHGGGPRGRDESQHLERVFTAWSLSIHLYKDVSKVDCGNCGYAYLSVRQLPALPPLCSPTEGGVWSDGLLLGDTLLAVLLASRSGPAT